MNANCHGSYFCAIAQLTFKASRCLFRLCSQDMRKVVVHHMEGGHNILSFVESRGVEALSKLHGCHSQWKGHGLKNVSDVADSSTCSTHQKSNMEPEKGLLKKEKHLYINHQFWGSMLVFVSLSVSYLQLKMMNYPPSVKWIKVD